jgi:GxxExxY protein
MTAEGAETAENLNRITERVIGAAMRVHQALGPGLLESAYEACLAFELTHSGMRVVQQQPLPVVYRDVRLSCGYRLDFIVEDRVIVEVKDVRVLKNGVRRLVHNFPNGSAVSALSAVHSLSRARMQLSEQQYDAAEVQQAEEVFGLVLPASGETSPALEPGE